MSDNNSYRVLDYTNVYSRIMQFDKNKSAFIHKWYPFVEGYSKDFIISILNELDYTPALVLDPFAGSGTTPLELQELGVSCYSFEVSPFMHKLASVKLENSYSHSDFIDALITVGKILNGDLTQIREFITPPQARTFEPKEGLTKWIFNRPVMDGILDIKYAISKIEDNKYRDLFYVALASILLEVSNAYRDGKSLKYKKNWKKIGIERTDVHKKFLFALNNVFLPDIQVLETRSYDVNNKHLCKLGDVRQLIKKLPENSIDLVITSPPYLNSRDYTDIYIAELWVLGLINNYDELRELRKNTLRSHVQVPIGKTELANSEELQKAINEFESNVAKCWNRDLLGMIKGYFIDMEDIFFQLHKKMCPGKKVFFNVANSAYYGIEIKVDEIIAEIAENIGFRVVEIRKARDLKPSSQQKHLIPSLRESIIVLMS